jgi:RNA polymerase sigma factor (sigma-70 family)
LSDEKKLIDVFADNYATLSKFAIMIVKNKDAALDVIQNVAFVIVTKAYNVSDIKNPNAFLLTCVRRAALNYLRNESRLCQTDPVILEQMLKSEYRDGSIDYLEWVMSLNRYLESYSPQLQKAFIMHYVDGCSLDAISKDLNMTPNALAQQFKRMRKKITQTSPEFKTLLMLLTFV